MHLHRFSDNPFFCVTADYRCSLNADADFQSVVHNRFRWFKLCYGSHSRLKFGFETFDGLFAFFPCLCDFYVVSFCFVFLVGLSEWNALYEYSMSPCSRSAVC